MGKEGFFVEAGQGESIESLAFEHGHFWETIWAHPENAALKAERGEPEVLLPGDRVYIPPIEPGSVSVQTGRSYRFRRRGVPSLLRLVLRDDKGPRADLPYALDIDGNVCKTGADGSIRRYIMPTAKTGWLLFGEGLAARRIELKLRCLDPVTSVRGVQARLKSLGYGGVDVTGELNPATEAAILRFKQKEGLPDDPPGLTDAVRARLKERFGT
jgi:N-acetylmuramoyl-L-alanine amidase